MESYEKKLQEYRTAQSPYKHSSKLGGDPSDSIENYNT